MAILKWRPQNVHPGEGGPFRKPEYEAKVSKSELAEAAKHGIPGLYNYLMSELSGEAGEVRAKQQHLAWYVNAQQMKDADAKMRRGCQWSFR